MKTLTVNDKDYAKAKKLLTDNGIETEVEHGNAIPLLHMSNAKPGETPVAFGEKHDGLERTSRCIIGSIKKRLAILS